MIEKLTITKNTGEVVVADLITFFTLNATGQKYVMYTFNETDANGLVKIHVGRFVDNPATISNIEDENEWNQVKIAMKEMATGGNN